MDASGLQSCAARLAAAGHVCDLPRAAGHVIRVQALRGQALHVLDLPGTAVSGIMPGLARVSPSATLNSTSPEETMSPIARCPMSPSLFAAA
jgi:hypothetical protein